MSLVLNKTHNWCTRIDKYSKWVRSNLISRMGLNLSFWRIWSVSLCSWRLLFCILTENFEGIHCCSDLLCRPTYVLKDRSTTQGPVLANTTSWSERNPFQFHVRIKTSKIVLKFNVSNIVWLSKANKIRHVYR